MEAVTMETTSTLSFDSGESMMTLAEATGYLPRNQHGKKITVRTLERWVRHGHRGVKLEGLPLGAKIYTSKEAIQRFSNALAAKDSGTPSVAEAAPKKPSTKSHRQASASLAKAGWAKPISRSSSTESR